MVLLPDMLQTSHARHCLWLSNALHNQFQQHVHHQSPLHSISTILLLLLFFYTLGSLDPYYRYYYYICFYYKHSWVVKVNHDQFWFQRFTCKDKNPKVKLCKNGHVEYDFVTSIHFSVFYWLLALSDIIYIIISIIITTTVLSQKNMAHLNQIIMHFGTSWPVSAFQQVRDFYINFNRIYPFIRPKTRFSNLITPSTVVTKVLWNWSETKRSTPTFPYILGLLRVAEFINTVWS